MFREKLETVYTADTRPFARGANQVDRRLASLERGVNTRLDRMDRRWERSGRALRSAVSTAAITAGLLAFGRQAVGVARSFEAAMNRVRAARGASQSQITALAAEARRLGQATSFSASQAADAIETLVRNGVAVPDILGGALQSSLALAEATGGDLARAADLATDVMAQFGFGAADLGRVVDTVTGAMINSKFGFDDFALAVGQGGAVAAQSGVEFSDFAAAIAATAQAFTSGSDAGTSFKTFVTRLTGNSKQAQAAIKALGLEFFTAEGALRPMREIAEELRTALAGLSEEARTTNLKTIFGSDAIRTAAALAEQGAAGFDRLAVSIGRVSAADQAEARMAGLEGAVRRASAAWEGLLLAFGDGGGLAAATTSVELLAGALNLLAENLDVVAAGAVTFAGARGGGALVTALNAQRAAVDRMVTARQAESRAANTAELAARQEVARRRAALQTLIQTEASTRRVANAKRSLAAATQQLNAATQSQIAATGALAAAQSRLTVTATLARNAMGALRGVMAFFGGPVGLAITAVSVGVLAIASSADTATTSVEALEARFQGLGQQIERVRQLDQALAEDTDRLTDANERLKKAIASQGGAAVDVARVEVDTIRKRIEANKQLRVEYANVLRAQLAVANRDLGTAQQNFRQEFGGQGLTRGENRSSRTGRGDRPARGTANARRDRAIAARRAEIQRRQDAGGDLTDEDERFLNQSAALSQLRITAEQTRAAIDALNAPAPSVSGVSTTPPPASTGGGGRASGGSTSGGGSDRGGLDQTFSLDQADRRLDAIEREREAIGKLGVEIAFLEERGRLLDEARQTEAELTPERIAQIEAQAAAYAAARTDVDRLKSAEELLARTAQENLTIEERRAKVAAELEQLRPALISLAGSELAAQEAINAELERTEKLLGKTGEIGESVGSAIGSAFEQAATNLDQADEAGKRLAITLARIALESALTPVLKSAGSFIGSLFAGFDTGGYTGAGGRNEVAGVVHKDEYVVRSPYARQALPLLERINNGALGRGFMAGGMVGAPLVTAPRLPTIAPSAPVTIHSENHFHAHGGAAMDPATMLEAFRPELDRRDRQIKADAVKAVSRRNAKDPGFLGA